MYRTEKKSYNIISPKYIRTLNMSSSFCTHVGESFYEILAGQTKGMKQKENYTIRLALCTTTLSSNCVHRVLTLIQIVNKKVVS